MTGIFFIVTAAQNQSITIYFDIVHSVPYSTMMIIIMNSSSSKNQQFAHTKYIYKNYTIFPPTCFGGRPPFVEQYIQFI